MAAGLGVRARHAPGWRGCRDGEPDAINTAGTAITQDPAARERGRGREAESATSQVPAGPSLGVARPAAARARAAHPAAGGAAEARPGAAVLEIGEILPRADGGALRGGAASAAIRCCRSANDRPCIAAALAAQRVHGGHAGIVGALAGTPIDAVAITATSNPKIALGNISPPPESISGQIGARTLPDSAAALDSCERSNAGKKPP